MTRVLYCVVGGEEFRESGAGWERRGEVVERLRWVGDVEAGRG